MRLTGNVVRVDRMSGRAEVAVGGVVHSVSVPYPDKRNPPCPLSQVQIEQSMSGQWQLSGDASQRSRILDEDFNYVDGAASPGTVAYADTTWLFSADIGGAWGTVGELPDDGGGVIELISGAGIGRVASLSGFQHHVASATSAIWFSAHATIEANIGQQADLLLGLDSSGSAQTYVLGTDYGTVTKLQGAAANVDTPSQWGTSIYHTVDVVVVGGAFSALWVDGDGPYYITTGVPAVGATLYVFAQVTAEAALNTFVALDWLRVERVTGLVHPAQVYDGNMPACPV